MLGKSRIAIAVAKKLGLPVYDMKMSRPISHVDQTHESSPPLTSGSYEWIELASNFARDKHEGQVMKFGPYKGKPYFMYHVSKVAGLLFAAHALPQYVAVALLHDVVEDTDATMKEIYEMFPDVIARDVEALTRREGEDYFEYIRERVNARKGARIVKIHDLMINLSNMRGKPDARDRYLKALNILVNNKEDEENEEK